MTVLTRGAYGNPGTSLAFKTGNWRATEKPVHVHLKAPCHAACPAGEDQQAWFAELQDVVAAWEGPGRGPERAWIVGDGFDESTWETKQLPTRQDLDALGG